MRIGVISLLQNIDPAYSVATVTLSHLRMLKLHGHEPVLITGTDSSLEEKDIGCEIMKILPVWHWKDYRLGEDLIEEDEKHVEEVKLALAEHTSGMRLLAHDMILQGWYRPYGEALMAADKVWHVIHSRVGGGHKFQLPEGHKIMVLNESLVEETRVWFGRDTICVPNAVDILEYNKCQELTRKWVKDWGLLDYDYIFTYPLSAPRWGAKGVDWLATFVKYMNIQGHKTALVLLLAHANTDQKFSFDTDHYSNVMYEEHKLGVSHDVVRDFMQISDGFLLPSVSETSSLVAQEAALSKNCVILNRILKLPYKAGIADMRALNDLSFEFVLRQFLDESKHLNEFRRVRKEMNEYRIGKRLSEWLCA